MKTVMMTEDFNRLISATRAACGKTGEKLIHSWIRLEFLGITVTAISTDGYRMNVERAACYDIDEDFTAYVKPNIKKLPRNMFVDIEKQGTKLFISCGDEIMGFNQPEGEFLDWKKTYADIVAAEPILRMGFNAQYMYEALSSLKQTASDFMREPIILELYDPVKPAILRTKAKGERVVLPVRLKD